MSWPAGRAASAGRTGSTAPSTSRRPDGPLLQTATSSSSAAARWPSSAAPGTAERPILRLEGCSSREDAEALRGSDLLVPLADAPPLEEGEFWAHDVGRLPGDRRRARGRRGGADGRPAVVRGARGGGPADPAGARRGPLDRPLEARRIDVDMGFLASDGHRRLHAVPAVVRLVPRAAPRRQRAGAGPHARVRRPARHDAAERRAGRRHAVRRRRGDGAARRRDGGGAAGPLRRGSGRAALAPARDRADARAAACSTTRSPRSSRGEEGADAAVRALRGLRRARSSSTSAPRRSRSGATCWPAASWRRWSCADTVLRKLPGRARPRGLGAGGVLQPGARRRARVPALHAPGRLARAGRCPTSCCPGTTSASGSGGSSRAARLPPLPFMSRGPVRAVANVPLPWAARPRPHSVRGLFSP